MDDGTIVLDLGTSSCKAGWSSEDGPRQTFPSSLPVSKPMAAVTKALRRMECIDGNVGHVRVGGAEVELVHAIERGEVRGERLERAPTLTS